MFYAFHYFQSNLKGTALWAEDETAALKLARQLKFELVKDTPRVYEFRPTVLMKLPGGLTRPDVLHAVCFLTFLASRYGIETEDLVNDNSPVHALAHALQFGGKQGVWPPIVNPFVMRNVIRQLVWLEMVAPGMPPANIELPILEKESPSVPIPGNPVSQSDIDYPLAELKLIASESEDDLYRKQAAWYRKYLYENS
jgi:hypothetical protein